MELTPEEKALAARVGFDENILSQIKSAVGEPLEQLLGLDDDYTEVPVRALSVSLPSFQKPTEYERGYTMIAVLREHLYPSGYHVFLTKRGLSHSLAFLKGDDQYQLLEWLKTDGANYDVTNTDVIERLRVWDSQYGISIREAGHDLVQFDLITLPENIAAFAQEVYDFCPDTVDQGTGLLEEYENLQADGWEIDPADFEGLSSTERGVKLLAAEIKKQRGVFLWWD